MSEASGPRRSSVIIALLSVAFAIACVVHLWGLYAPRVELPSDAPGTDKWIHLVGFGLPVALGWLRFPARRWWVVAAFALHAVVSELLQGWVLPGRTGDAIDALADLVGVALGAALGWGAARLLGGARDRARVTSS